MPPALRDLLKSVSRSFYVSLAILPSTLRNPLGLAFLCCKAADTIADTDQLPAPQRLMELERYRCCFDQAEWPQCFLPPAISADNAEGKLLKYIPQIFSTLSQLPIADQQHIRWLVLELTEGMVWDLTRFDPLGSELSALADETELDRYTYFVAGCVGRFWTRMLTLHCGFAKNWGSTQEDMGEQFGRGLQMVNILRDLPRDLVRGRCYLPESVLTQFGVKPKDLRDPKLTDSKKNLRQYFLKKTRTLLSAGKKYTARIPWHHRRLRSAALLPMQLGFHTLESLEASPNWLDPNTIIKVPRHTVYRELLRALFT